MQSVKEFFTAEGGEFTTDVEQILLKIPQIKAFIFDWDGVFNDGTKNENMTSLFAEPDSMGTNLLRFSFWLDHKSLPPVAIISGEKNSSAHKFATRERINAFYFKFANKTDALLDFCAQNNLKPDEIAFVFDDVIDLTLAQMVGLRFLVRRKGSPLMTNFVRNNDLCDYITACRGGEHAVREVCELMMGLRGNFDRVMKERMLFGDLYKNYVREKNQSVLTFYTWRDEKVTQTDF